MKCRSGLALVAAVAVSAGSLLAVQSQAAFARGAKQAVCGVNGEVDFSPGLSTVAQVQRMQIPSTLIGGSPQSCPYGPGSLSGAFRTTTAVDCSLQTNGVGQATGKITIAWNDATTSVLRVTLGEDSSVSPSLMTFVGRVKSGHYVGLRMYMKATYTDGTGQDCQNTPVTTWTFPGTASPRMRLLTFV